MYWTDWDRNAIFKANKFNGEQADAVTSEDLVSVFMLAKLSIYGHPLIIVTISIN